MRRKCGGKLPYRTNFLLDEFANMPPLKDVDTMVSAARSRRMRFFFVIQNYAQLSEVYGKEKGDTIRGNCTNTVYLISTELAALKEISEMCGEIKVKTDKKDKDGKAIEETRPLITVSDLQKLKVGEIVLLRSRMDPFRTKLKLDYQIDWGDKCEKATYPTRDKQPLHVFDLKTFVNKKREEKREESMNKLISQVMPNMNRNNASSMPGVNRPNVLPGMAPSNNRKPMSMEEMLKNIDKAVEKLEKEEQRKQAGIMGKTNTVGKVNPVKVPASMANDSTIDPTKVNTNVAMPKMQESGVKAKPIQTIQPRPVVMPTTQKKDIASSPKVENKTEVNKIIDSADFAAKITNKVNQTVKEDRNISVKSNVKPQVSKPEMEKAVPKKNDYVTDDQFFDDFFADDDD